MPGPQSSYYGVVIISTSPELTGLCQRDVASEKVWKILSDHDMIFMPFSCFVSLMLLYIQLISNVGGKV